MLGVVVYRLRTEVGGHFTMFPGKLLHGALFRYFSAYDAALAADVHARQAKPFTVGSLYRTDTVPQDARAFHAPSFSVGSAQFLRVTGLDSDALAAFERMPCGTKLQVGKLVFSVTEVIADGREETGAIAPDVLAAAVLSMEGVRRVRFSFRTPTVFRTDSGDCAVPYPELIFASLADKWTQFSLPGVLHKETPPPQSSFRSIGTEEECGSALPRERPFPALSGSSPSVSVRCPRRSRRSSCSCRSSHRFVERGA